MIRLLLFFVALALVAYGGMWLVQHPGQIEITWLGYEIHTSAALLLIAIALGAIILWSIVRAVLGLPSFVRLTARQRRRERGYEALTRGLVAVGSGDAASAAASATRAYRKLGDEPLALMLEAQAAHLGGDEAAAVRAFKSLADREDTRLFGLRGLFSEATRRGDDDAARHFAELAYRAKPLPWSAQAMLESHARNHEWERALALVNAAVSSRLLDKGQSDRQRAVLETAVALEKEATEPDAALSLARAAIGHAPDLAPPIALAARLLARRGDIRKAARLIEKAWPACQHPQVAEAYLDVRPGDSTADRLARAKTLMNLSTHDPVSRQTVARAALANKEFADARSALEPLVAEGKRPSVRVCLLMAELEDAEHGDIGQAREWLARASRAPLDPAWIADGIEYEHWAPASPTTGKLDAFRWQVPAERLGPSYESLPAPTASRIASAQTLARLKAPEEETDTKPALLANDTVPPRKGTAAVPTEADVGAVAAAELAVTAPNTKPKTEPNAGPKTEIQSPTAIVAAQVAPVAAPDASPAVSAPPTMIEDRPQAIATPGLSNAEEIVDGRIGASDAATSGEHAISGLNGHGGGASNPQAPLTDVLDGRSDPDQGAAAPPAAKPVRRTTTFHSG